MNEGVFIDSGEGTYLIGSGKRTWLEKPSNGISFYFPDFFLESKRPWFIHESVVEVPKSEFLVTQASGSSFVWENHSKRKFEAAFRELQAKFTLKHLNKAVLYVFETARGKLEVSQVLYSMHQYAMKYPVFLYGFWGEGEGMLGATPELLFKTEGKLLETVACAGTASEEEGLLQDKKQMKEHEWVVTGIRESLSPFGRFERGETRVQKYTKLCHLITPIKVKLNEQIPIDAIVNCIHPTPALGAHPRKAGMEWLKEYENLITRGRFGAPVGYSRGAKSVCYVAIRNVQWEGDLMKLGAGSGIVPESELENEWSEIELKLKSIKEILFHESTVS